jgi:hypothetical protein
MLLILSVIQFFMGIFIIIAIETKFFYIMRLFKHKKCMTCRRSSYITDSFKNERVKWQKIEFYLNFLHLNFNLRLTTMYKMNSIE